MPVIGPVLGLLIQSKMRTNFQALGGIDPISQGNPSYFIQFTLGLGKGFMEGTPAIMFVSQDLGIVAAPAPIPGVGHGVGIQVDAKYMSQLMYTKMRAASSQFGNTMHDPWPPTAGNSGEMLKAMTDAICDSIKEHYAQSLILSSIDPLLITGTGKIMKGSFSGLVPQIVSAAIIKNTGSLAGKAWVPMTMAIAEAYVDAIHTQATASIDIGAGGGGAVPSVSSGVAA